VAARCAPIALNTSQLNATTLGELGVLHGAVRDALDDVEGRLLDAPDEAA